MDYLDYLDYVRYVPPVVPPRMQEMNPFQDLTEDEFKDRYRLSRESVQELIRLLSNRINENDVRGPHGIPTWKQVLIALRFFAVGTFHRETGDLYDVGESTVCKIVHRVALAICLEMKDEYIKFPTGDYAMNTKNNFFENYGFPGVLSVVDGTLIPIACPATPDKEEYRCRKGFFAINVMVACGANLEITNIVARWKGSTHDSRVFKNSSLYAKFEEQDMGGILLGDSGYECNRFMITPLGQPMTAAEHRFQRALKATRCCIERTFGELKGRFRCLHKENTLRFNPRRSCIVIIACAILHNFGKLRDGWGPGSVDGSDSQDGGEEENLDQDQTMYQDLEERVAGRDNIIRQHFS